MTTEEREDKFQKWITYSAIIAIPIIFTLGLFWLELKNRVDDVQQSRAELTYISCLEQNERNVDARKAIKDIFDVSVQHGEQTQAEANTAQAATDTIIAALAPHRDCQALVEERFGYVPSAPLTGDDA